MRLIRLAMVGARVLPYDYLGRRSMTLAATSLKLPKTLKSRITRLAKRAGESPHAFMLRVLEDQVEAAERFERFVADARYADQRMQESGQGYVAADVYGYLKARIAGRLATRPKPAQWRK
jgi:predicted DNA-binding protein